MSAEETQSIQTPDCHLVLCVCVCVVGAVGRGGGGDGGVVGHSISICG